MCEERKVDAVRTLSCYIGMKRLVHRRPGKKELNVVGENLGVASDEGFSDH